MTQGYITKIRSVSIPRLPALDGLEIDLSSDDDAAVPRHLIVTGPNASGKTSLLAAISQELDTWVRGSFQTLAELHSRAEACRASREVAANARERARLTADLVKLQRQLEARGVELTMTAPQDAVFQGFRDGSLIFAYVPALRIPHFPPAQQTTAPRTGPVPARESLSGQLQQLLLNLRAEWGFAAIDREADKHDVRVWFDRLESGLRELLEEPGLSLTFHRSSFRHYLKLPDGQEISFEQLADGHSAALAVLVELLARIDAARRIESEAPKAVAGVAIIDEIETHLHVALQEKILPFFTTAFPQLQFIVATHSPAVIASIDDALVVDLRTQEMRLSNELRGTPYGMLMQTHFGLESEIDRESTRQLQELRRLARTADRDPEQQRQLKLLAEELRRKSRALALEVWSCLNLADEQALEGGVE